MKRVLFFLILVICSIIYDYSQEPVHNKSKPELEAVYFGINTGVWIPTNNLSKVGVHPLIGFTEDIKYGKMYYGMSIDFRFLRSKNDYDFYYEYLDTTVLTDYCRGAKFGLSIGYDIIQRGHYSMVAHINLAYDNIKAIDKPDDIVVHSTKSRKDMQKYMHSYNVSAVIKNRFDFSNNMFLEIGISYNFLDYTLQNRSALSGDALILNIAYGVDVHN